MPTVFSNIVKAIQRAIPIVAAIPNHPKAKLRELVEPLCDEYICAHRINLRFEPRNERTYAFSI